MATLSSDAVRFLLGAYDGVKTPRRHLIIGSPESRGEADRLRNRVKELEAEVGDLEGRLRRSEAFVGKYADVCEKVIYGETAKHSEGRFQRMFRCARALVGVAATV